MKGKAIYQPTGKAAEYALYACNFYTGCSNGCDYCYCRKGIMAHTWSEKPKLKKCFVSDDHALTVFKKELLANKEELQKHGLFFSFSTDPMLYETYDLTMQAAGICYNFEVPVTILTKSTWFLNDFRNSPFDFATVGFTLTGHDELETKAPTNAKRIATMRALHEAGFKTWASIEPVVHIVTSIDMMWQTQQFCGYYKVGLQSGKKYDTSDLIFMYNHINKFMPDSRVTFKESFLKTMGSQIKGIPEIEKANTVILFSISTP